MKFQVPKAEDWVKVLGLWISSLKPGDILLLVGPMAAGKTTFVRSMLSHWGFSQVASPTYALHHRYQNKSLTVDHWDLYRLKNLEDLESTAFWDLLQEDTAISMIEWPGLLPKDSLPENRRRFRLEIIVREKFREVLITPLE